jgi:hypothetical protein
MIRIFTSILFCLLLFPFQESQAKENQIQAESFVTIPANLDFGKQRLNNPRSLDVVIKNTGDSSFIQTLYMKKSKTFFIETEVSEIALSTDSSVTVTITYIPMDESAQGTFDTDSLVLQTETKLFYFPLKGQGIAPKLKLKIGIQE